MSNLLTIMFNQICTLLQQPQNMDIENNVHIYGFAVNIYQRCEKFKKYKPGSILRLLAKLNEIRVHTNTEHYKKLTEIGYSDLNIKHLNYAFPVLFPSDKSLKIDTLSHEKNVIDYCKAILEKTFEFSEREKNELSKLFQIYRTLYKKYKGKDNLLDAVLNEITINSKDVYIWLFNYLRENKILDSYINSDLFLIDPLDEEKVSLLSKMSQKEQYAILTLFLHSKYGKLKNDKEKLKSILDIFCKQTGYNFLDIYTNKQKISNNKDDTYKFELSYKILLLFIETDIIKFNDFLIFLKSGTLYEEMRSLIISAIKHDEGGKGITFLEEFNSEIGIKNFDDIFKTSFPKLWSNNYYYSSITQGLRDLLSSTKYTSINKQKIFLLLFEYCYYNKSCSCVDFLIDFLLMEKSEEVFNYNQLLQLFTNIMDLKVQIDSYRLESLRKRFLPEDVYKSICAKEVAEKRAKQEKINNDKDNAILSDMQMELDNCDEPIELLKSFLTSYSYTYSFSNKNKKFNFIYETLNLIIDNNLNSGNIGYIRDSLYNIMSIKQYLLKQEFISFEDFLSSMNDLNTKLIAKEVC